MEPVVTERAGDTDLLSGLRRIGIDEISYRKGQRYLTCAVDHDTGRLVWAAEGRNSETILAFFDALGDERTKLLTHVSADGAEWIHTPVRTRAPHAVLCLDPFHVVAWATDAVDQVRCGMWNILRGQGNTDQASDIKGTRWAVLKNPGNLTGEQRTTLAAIAKTNNRLYRALPAQGTTPRGVRPTRQTRTDPARQLARLGRTLPHPRIHQASHNHPALSPPDPQHPRPRTVQRPQQIHQHTPTSPHPTHYGFRTPEALITMAMLTPKRPLPTTPRTILKGLTPNLR